MSRPPTRCSIIALELSRRDKRLVFFAQLRLLLLQAQAGIFVTADSLARTEHLAQELLREESAA